MTSTLKLLLLLFTLLKRSMTLNPPNFTIINQQAIWGDEELHGNAKLRIYLPDSLDRGEQEIVVDLATDIPLVNLTIWQSDQAGVEVVAEGGDQDEFRLTIQTHSWFTGKERGEEFDLSFQITWKSELKTTLPEFTAVNFRPTTTASTTGVSPRNRLIVSGYNTAIATYTIQGSTLWKEQEIQVEPNLSWLEVSNNSVYGIHEWAVPDGPLARWDIKNGAWSKQESVNTGSGPAHVQINKEHEVAYVANYGEGSFTAVRLQGEKLAEIIYTEQFGEGCRDKSHVHQSVSREDVVWVVDLGCDSIYRYKYINEQGLVKTGVNRMTEGGGPRHMALHPTSQLAFVVMELKSLVEVHSVDRESGEMNLLQQINLVNRTGVNYGAEILVHPNGGFVYASSRGEGGGVVVVYQLKESSLEKIQEQEVSGTWPRSMALSPSGDLLAVADQKGDTVQILEVDVSTGRLTSGPGDSVAETPSSPAFVAFI